MTPWIRPLTIGDSTFPVNLIQGPLAGYSCSAFRRLCWQYSQPAYACTEMISCRTLLHKNRTHQQRFVHIDPMEGPVCFQLATNQPIELAEAAKRVSDYGADLIDLNCGCPVKKIRSKGAGSRLLATPSQLYTLITTLKKNTHLPITVKIRVDGHSHETFNQQIAQVIRDTEPDALIVHGRHWTEHYETPCQLDQIHYFVDAVDVPVIGNGDVACLETLKNMLATGVSGVMIGRAGVGQPWLIKQLIAQLNNEPFTLPTLPDIGNTFIEHVKQLAKLLKNDKFAILQARKMSKYYARGYLDNKAEFCAAINQADTMDAFIQLTENFFVNVIK